MRNRTSQQRTVREEIAERALEFVQIGLQLLPGRLLGYGGTRSVGLRDALDLGWSVSIAF
jgi:hypothetical protein